MQAALLVLVVYYVGDFFLYGSNFIPDTWHAWYYNIN